MPHSISASSITTTIGYTDEVCILGIGSVHRVVRDKREESVTHAILLKMSAISEQRKLKD